jgi:hypothetical protein
MDFYWSQQIELLMSIDELVSRRYRKNMEWLVAGIVRSLALFDMLEMREYNVELNLKSKTPAAAHTFIIGLSATYEGTAFKIF